MIMVDLWPLPKAERIDLGEEPSFDLGGMRVRPAERAIIVNGERRELQPRVMQVLVALAKARPDVLSRDRLIDLCWEGRVVGDDSLNRCILALRHLAQEFTPPPFAIETVPRIGHRLTANGEAPAAEAKEASPRIARRWRLAAAAVLLLVVTAVGIFLWQQRTVAVEPASIAVLPFRNLSSGEAYFAEGVGEEILNQLAREPGFRVAGRASAAQFKPDTDPREIGRKLGVDYLLEGSVRSDGGRVRISASLVQTKDGMRLWSETYDRTPDDILQIQAAIGQAVANGLRRSLVHSSPRRAVNGQAYALYLAARAVLRTSVADSASDAVAMLEQSIRLDPTYAPAWASLSEAIQLNATTKDDEALIAAWPRAVAAARRAVQLDPNLADGHGRLAALYGGDTREAVEHLRRAAELAPRTGEGLVLRAEALDAEGRFEESVEAYRAAHEVDPLWQLPVRGLIDMTATMGDRAAAEDVVRRGFPDDELLQNFALGRVAWHMGDYSEAVRRWSVVADSQARYASPAKLSLEDLMYALHLSSQLPSRPPRPFIGDFRFGPRAWMSAAPSPSEWRWRNRSRPAAMIYHAVNIVGAKLMLNSGRARELVATYDGPTGLLGIQAGDKLAKCQVLEVPIVALALRQVGRGAEADALLRQSDALIRRVYRGSKVPTWFDQDAAAVWAVQGNNGQAIEALDRSFRRGWVHAGRHDLPRIEDEPAFRLLRTDPRFETLRAKYRQHFARERAETARVLNIRT